MDGKKAGHVTGPVGEREERSGGVQIAAKFGRESGDIGERRAHVKRRSLEDVAIREVPLHVFARDHAHHGRGLGGDLRRDEGNREMHGAGIDRAEWGKCRSGRRKLRRVTPACARTDPLTGNSRKRGVRC